MRITTAREQVKSWLDIIEGRAILLTDRPMWFGVRVTVLSSIKCEESWSNTRPITFASLLLSFHAAHSFHLLVVFDASKTTQPYKTILRKRKIILLIHRFVLTHSRRVRIAYTEEINMGEKAKRREEKRKACLMLNNDQNQRFIYFNKTPTRVKRDGMTCRSW